MYLGSYTRTTKQIAVAHRRREGEGPTERTESSVQPATKQKRPKNFTPTQIPAVVCVLHVWNVIRSLAVNGLQNKRPFSDKKRRSSKKTRPVKSAAGRDLALISPLRVINSKQKRVIPCMFHRCSSTRRKQKNKYFASIRILCHNCCAIIRFLLTREKLQIQHLRTGSRKKNGENSRIKRN